MMNYHCAKWWMLLSLLMIDVPALAFFARYKHDKITIYSLCGYHWGWDNDKQLSEQELEFLIEKFQAESKDGREKKNQQKRERRTLKKKSRNRLTLAVEQQQTPQDLYKLMGTQPTHMIYIESNSAFWGLKSLINRWFFNVSWHDDSAPQMLSIINETGQTVFVELNHNPLDLLAPKNLKGILNGHARRISLMSDTTLIIWHMQTTNESAEQLITRLPIAYETSLVQLSMQQDKIVGQVIDGMDDEETI